MHGKSLRFSLVVLGTATLALYATSCSSAHDHHAPAHAAAAPAAKPAATAASREQAEGAGEEQIDVAKLPEPVQAAAKHAFGKLDGLEASKESDEGLTLYEINGKGSDGADLSIKCVAGGQVVELERGIPLTGLPGDAAANLKKAFPDGTAVSAEEIEMHFFEVRVTSGGKTEEVRVDASGRVYREERESEEEGRGEDEEHEEHEHR